MTTIKRAIVAPYDKTGIAEFARALSDRGIEILSTHGTAKVLRAAGIKVTEVQDYTGSPEILGGRVKTLHPKIHGGLLGRRDDPEHVAQMVAHGILPIDLLVLNLYPFVQTISRPGVTLAEAVEQIDIGGPAMLRAAAKNHAHVVPLVDAKDYPEFLRRLDGDALDPDYRRGLAAKAYRHTALYDAAIARYLGEGDLPPALVLGFERVDELRYGENPHQRAALYREPGGKGIAQAEVLGEGKQLSFNNIQDAAGAYATVADLPAPAVVVVKHANPCGAAAGRSLLDAFRRAWEGDPISAFGGILAFNAPVTPDVAEAIAEPGRFVEVIVAPAFDGEALEILTTKPKWGKNVRILRCPLPEPSGFEVRGLPGGLLLQERDGKATQTSDLKTVTKRAPSEAEASDLVFAQRVCKHVKSNAIVLAKDAMVVGVGAGQMSRVDAARIAVRKAGKRAQGAVFASDAFLPFNDALEVALEAGVTAAIQPGGSRNDEACIRLADERGIAMVFTGVRHFLH
ncbi:MAG: bifunctional phosphoribosylaminoimidazolecarboxamide formyltransferase/IMP cyclohydrolase [Planctomycetes bacterium]|nr:bifunctional phosphoribosylaminoimidazolecarboxamide formyltransferase/IMP cyclohydrolase [Planctomycetota bacterium]